MIHQVKTSSGAVIGGPSPLVRRFLAQGGSLVDPLPRNKNVLIAGRKARVLVVVHGWFPHLAAGSERMLQHMLSALPRDEFEIEILSFGAAPYVIHDTEYEYDGVHVTVGYDPPAQFEPDLIITHHGPGARVTHQLSQEFPDAKIVAVFHNERFDIPDILGLEADLNVFNTHWVADALQTDGIVVHPPLEYDRHHVDQTGRCVTLVNLQKNKGVDTFYALAGRMDVPFLGVIGTHGEQEIRRFENDYNVQIMETTQDMREVWRKTSVVLMPSEYESYGMVAAEALVSGIPVIAHPTPGLVECLDWAGIFVDRNDTVMYEQALRLLLTDQEHYRERSAMASLRAAELVSQSQEELSTFVDRVRELVFL